ncbi:MAG: hypothetical protein M1839_009258 [Geoglossum umbratile]|nr:MAG: hypothetical protein M1839_009258 [Geoglossum umbratile]
MWTRFFPLCGYVRGLVGGGGIGDVQRVFADLSSWKDVGKWSPRDRIVNPELAGGALLDLGVYSLTWVFQILYHLQPAGQKQPPTVCSTMTKYLQTGVDEMTSIILNFPTPTANAHGIALTGFRTATDPAGYGNAGPAVRIQGTKGEVQVFGPLYLPREYRVIVSGVGDVKQEAWDLKTDVPGKGLFWEADACARCLRDGKQECEVMPWEESIAIMDVIDKVREQNGLRYPDAVESAVYDD